ncbi:uncharacterized protein LOC117209430 isoform X1 [Bombus bifarius]|uniref:Uncharacterized protein LOC117209430 isoform X1 n=1 Tax=Bombus bifarius TaxID=103933 RepID=A0A6P8M1R7_9HYME|nr:uncharacterized protein LOC117209430 isoform X1 [Bombus bifarius]
MARSIFYVVPLCFVLLVAWADDRVLLTEEDERRWNTPPELIPEQLIKTSDVKSGRSLSIPITTNINVNAGNNAHSLGFQLVPEGVSYSESNSFGHPLSAASGGVSQSQSVSFSAGLTGIAGAVSEAASQYYPIYGNVGNVNSQVFGFDSAAATSSGSTQNGHATSSAASSVGFAHSSATSSIGAVRPSQGTTIRFPGQNQNRPMWSNIRPNNNKNNGHHPPRMPKLDIEVKPHRENNRGTIKLHVSTHETKWDDDQPKIHIHKWQPSSRTHDDDEQT